MKILFFEVLLRFYRRYLFRLKFLAGYYSYEIVLSCPLCNGTKLDHFASYHRDNAKIKIKRCHSCGLLLQNPRLDKRSLECFYRTDYRLIHAELSNRGDPTFLERNFQREIRRGRYICQYLESNGFFLGERFVVEIGCGFGGILYHFQERGARVLGCDLDPVAVQYGAGKGMNLIHGEAAALSGIGFGADLVIMSHVLEHYADCYTILQDIKRLMAEGALLYVEVPGIDQPRSNMERNAQLGHMYYFNLLTLRRMIENAGFRWVCGNEIVQAIFRWKQN